MHRFMQVRAPVQVSQGNLVPVQQAMYRYKILSGDSRFLMHKFMP
ncbi:hypothetical protein A2U01_0051342, partial [Trifolium medium]|nr:hypothetical protein [Trifolium medium]